MSEQETRPPIKDPDSPATPKQREYLVKLGVDPSAANDTRVTKAQASSWIDDFRRQAEGKSTDDKDVQAAKPPAPTAHPPPSEQAAGFQTADKIAKGATSPAPPQDDEGPGQLVPFAMLPKEQRAIATVDTRTEVVQGTSWEIIPQMGMPARFVFARVGLNRRSNMTEVRLYPGIEGLTWRANTYHGGIKSVKFEWVDPKSIPGFQEWTTENNDTQIVARCTVVLGDGHEATDEGTVRRSEAVMWGRRPSVVRSFPLEMAKKRSLSRALRWATGYGGTTAEEMEEPPVVEATGREVNPKAGLPGGPAALPPATG